MIVPPKGFLEGVRRLCDRYKILLILDEVVTGFGQTGTMFACEYEGITPDILVTGKALTSGYIPGSAVIMRKEIGDVLDRISLHGHTHSCYPLACAAALKNIEIIERDGLVENSRIVGAYLHEELKKCMADFPEIGDVRGRGLLQGFELEDQQGGMDKWELGQRLYETMLHGGLVTELESRRNLSNVVIVLHPALIVTKRDIDRAVTVIRESLKACRR